MHVLFRVRELFQPPRLGDVNKANCNPIFSTQIASEVNENSLGIQKSGLSILTPKTIQHTKWDVSVALKYPFPPKRVFACGEVVVSALPLTQTLVGQPRPPSSFTEPTWN